MNRASRYGLRVAGFLATALAAVGVAFIMSMDSRVSGSVIARPIGWVIPLAALAVIVAVSWVLLTQRRCDQSAQLKFDRTRCTECDREVLGQWRMCPYCGAMLDRQAAPAVMGSGTLDN